MKDTRDTKRLVPLSEDMLYSRMIAVALLIGVPVAIYAGIRIWDWLFW